MALTYSLRLSLALSGSYWISPCLFLALWLYGSLWLPLWLSLALNATLWHTLALSGSLLLSNFAYTAFDWLTGPLLGSQRRCHDDALSPALPQLSKRPPRNHRETKLHYIGLWIGPKKSLADLSKSESQKMWDHNLHRFPKIYMRETELQLLVTCVTECVKLFSTETWPSPSNSCSDTVPHVLYKWRNCSNLQWRPHAKCIRFPSN